MVNPMDSKLQKYVDQFGSPAEQVAMRASTPSIASTRTAERNSLPMFAGSVRWNYELGRQDAMKACAAVKDYLASSSK